ncbi:protein DEK isoform X1 [Lampris incognitus]|uniref:protein DEK isoform X1 n=1 Tax=Lampris incognitus TaxID=2546036 RepID=UPI0024B57706|nr:protein DEK isoform X1 [Lampris incognitus]
MSELAEELLESSAVSEEEVEEPKKGAQTDQPEKKGRLRVQGEILEGKRTKKTIERLDFQISKPKEKLKVEDGGGDKLGDIPRTNYHIGKMKPVDLKPLHTILFDRPGKMATMRKNMRLFNGFPFELDSEPYIKKREKLLRTSSFTNSKLRVICKVLDLEKKGTQSDLIDRILTFLIAPKNSGRPLLSKKKKRSKKNLSGSDSKTKTKKKSKPKPKRTSTSPKKSKAGSKSKAIVMDSSSDDDDEEEEEEEDRSGVVEDDGSDNEEKLSNKEEEQSEDSADQEEDEQILYHQSPKSKPSKGKAASKKSTPVKRPRPPGNKTAPPKKRVRKEASDQSESDADSDSEPEEKPKKKATARRGPPAKPAAKTKKADSSSNSKKTASKVTEDSSDDDEPLIKMIKKDPSDEQLKETVQSLLKEANLEEMTMKQICQKVYDTYPEHDLTSRKDYIKQTVKSLIT